VTQSVLLVDDDPAVLDALARRLRKEPYRVLKATSGTEALALLARSEVDLIVSDMRMPGMNGAELLAKVEEQYPACVRIMLTGEPSLAVAMAAINDGKVCRFLTKPYDADALAAIIRDALRRRGGAEGAAGEDALLKDSILAGALDCILTTDGAGRVLGFNPAAERTLGYSRAAVLGKSVADVFRPSGLRDLLTGGLAAVSGTGGEGELFGRLLETTAARPDGAEVPVELMMVVVRNAGRPIFTSFIRDVSQRKAAEAALRKAEAQLRQAQKLEALGRLAGGVAHDFNNLLTVISGYSELLLADPGVTASARESVQLIWHAGERAAGLTRQLLAFSRRRDVVPDVIDLNRLLLDLDRMLRRLVGEHIKLVALTCAEPVCVLADRGQLEQVVMNLVVNACDAMPGGGQVTVEAAPGTGGAGAWGVLSVRDTGCGMDDETKAHAFEPFFTTKEIGKGTGLGLSTVYGIVGHWGGHVELDTAPGRGTVVRAYLPRAEGGRPGTESAPAEPAAPAGRETVLLAEDEGSVRRLACAFLKAGGYQVLEAGHAAEALELMERRAGRIDLLVTDVVMPQMTGPQLAKHFRVRRPEGKVLFVSGYLDPRAVAGAELAEGQPFLRKPFTRRELLAKVRHVLDGTAGPGGQAEP
jgi:PAS domain S-box-containing protein